MAVAAKAASNIPGSSIQLVKLIKTNDLESITIKQATGYRSGLSLDLESKSDCIIFHSSGSSGKPKVGVFSSVNTPQGDLTILQYFLADIAETQDMDTSRMLQA